MRSTAGVQVLVKDDNDNIPVFIQDGYTFIVEEEVRAPTVLGSVRATDADRVDAGESLSCRLAIISLPREIFSQIDREMAQW